MVRVVIMKMISWHVCNGIIKQRLTFNRINKCCRLHHEVIMKINTHNTVFKDF